MKLTTLKITELDSLLSVTEKYIDYLVRDMHLTEKYSPTKYNELCRIHDCVIDKRKMILNEVNKRINEIKNEESV